MQYLGSSPDVFGADVLELHPHRLARMKLEGQDAFSQSQLRTVCEIKDQAVVEVVLNVSSFGDDYNLVPVVELEEFLEARLIDHFGSPKGLP